MHTAVKNLAKFYLAGGNAFSTCGHLENFHTPSLQRATSLSPLSRGRRDSVHRLPAGQRPGGVLDRAQDSPPRALPQIPAGSRLSPGSPPLPDARRGPAHPANDLAPLPGPAHSSRRDPAYLDSALVPPLEALFIPPPAPTPPEPAVGAAPLLTPRVTAAAMPGGLLLGDEAPNFEANTTIGRIRFHDYLGDSWGILFSHPRDFTPVCTTELGRAAKLAPEFAKRNVKMIALSIDSVEDHLAWSKDINAYNGEEPTEKLPFPIIDDKNRDLAIQLGMLDPAERDEKGMPVTARVVFIFGPDKKLKLSILYPATTGRNFDEILRVIISLQLTAEKRVATPVDWKNGDSVMVLPTIPEEEAKKLFPKGVFTKELPSGKKYLRYTPQP